jgi:hypothetical protein
MNEQTGMVYNKEIFADGDTSWIFDSTSIETWGSSWQDFGYEIVFRIDEIRAPDRVVRKLKGVFMKPFGLPQNQYCFEPTFWRVYWNRGQLRASMIKASEYALDRVASENGIVVKLNGVIIQPRPKGYIQHCVESNTG